ELKEDGKTKEASHSEGEVNIWKDEDMEKTMGKSITRWKSMPRVRSRQVREMKEMGGHMIQKEIKDLEEKEVRDGVYPVQESQVLKEKVEDMKAIEFNKEIGGNKSLGERIQQPERCVNALDVAQHRITRTREVENENLDRSYPLSEYSGAQGDFNTV